MPGIQQHLRDVANIRRQRRANSFSGDIFGVGPLQFGWDTWDALFRYLSPTLEKQTYLRFQKVYFSRARVREKKSVPSVPTSQHAFCCNGTTILFFLTWGRTPRMCPKCPRQLAPRGIPMNFVVQRRSASSLDSGGW